MIEIYLMQIIGSYSCISRYQSVPVTYGTILAIFIREVLQKEESTMA
jgi:hypothetical protein